MQLIENEWLNVSIDEKGAELTSIFHKKNQLHYLYDANPTYWKRHAPILFPFVGRLKEDTYVFKGKTYHLPQHGFARDKTFEVVKQTKETMTLMLKEDKHTLCHYPFSFNLYVTYELKENQLNVSYKVQNTGKEEMYFSLGAHPAFCLPLAKTLSFSDYYLEFEDTTVKTRYPLKGPFIDETKKVQMEQNLLPLSYEDLKEKQTYILTTPHRQVIHLKSDKDTHGLTLSYKNFPYLGIWTNAEQKAPFICLEPWYGLSDTTTHSKELTTKKGIQCLAKEAVFQTQFTLRFF